MYHRFDTNISIGQALICAMMVAFMGFVPTDNRAMHCACLILTVFAFWQINFLPFFLLK